MVLPSASVEQRSQNVAGGALRRRESNWVHPALFDGITAECGRGIIASQVIPQGTLLAVYGGQVMTLEEFEALPPELQNFPYQVEDNLLIGPRHESELGVGERLNHSCEPNAGFDGPIHLVSTRTISAGESITIDYATCVSAESDAFVMQCKCGEKSCRGLITGEDWKRRDIQDRLYPYFQPYLQRKIRALRPDMVARIVFRDEQGIANQDRVATQPPKTLQMARIIAWPFVTVAAFVRNAFRYDWAAIVVSLIAALPSNVLTCFLVVWGAEWLQEAKVFESEAMYISAVSLMTGVVGYATYLIMYYGGMLWAERAELWVNGSFSWRQFGIKWRVIAYDFVMHLPSDFLVLPLMSAGQGGMYVAGMSQFWSIFWAQAIADASYAVKEPLFWHAAKKLANFSR